MDKACDVIKTITALKRAKPFQPFVIVLSNGEKELVEDPDRLAVSVSAVHYASLETGRMHHITAAEVAAVHVVTPDPAEGRMREMILTLKHREPFVQFQIVLNSGDRYLIENPDLLAVGKSELAYYFPRSNRVAFLRANQIVAVEQMEEKPAA